MRAPLSLVAVAVAVALIAGLLIGGQLWHLWSRANGTSPAGQVQLTSLEQLEARPLHLPAIKTAQDCVSGPYTPSGDWGPGPLYAYAGASSTTGWGEYFYVVIYTDAHIGGPVLVRIRDMLRDRPVAIVGPFASGPAIGTDKVEGNSVTQFTELVLDEGHTTAGGWQPGWPIDHHRYVWDFMAGVPTSTSLVQVLGWQIDGRGFSETFVIC